MQGVILGTAAYKSPEQAKGKPLDKRADIWAFGCVLYEMLSGRAVFGGDSVATIGFVVTRDPDWSALPPQTPSALTRLLARCLAKDPRHRLRDIGDASIELEHADDVNPSTLAAQMVQRHGWPMWSLPVVIALSAAGAIAAAAWFGRATPAPRPVVRFDLIARDLRVDPHRHPIISPDGHRIAWAAGGSLWLRELDRTEARALVPDVDPVHLAWSPDSQQIMFFAANRLWRVRTTGGRTRGDRGGGIPARRELARRRMAGRWTHRLCSVVDRLGAVGGGGAGGSVPAVSGYPAGHLGLSQSETLT